MMAGYKSNCERYIGSSSDGKSNNSIKMLR